MYVQYINAGACALVSALTCLESAGSRGFTSRDLKSRQLVSVLHVCNANRAKGIENSVCSLPDNLLHHRFAPERQISTVHAGKSSFKTKKERKRNAHPAPCRAPQSPATRFFSPLAFRRAARPPAREEKFLSGPSGEGRRHVVVVV